MTFLNKLTVIVSLFVATTVFADVPDLYANMEDGAVMTKTQQECPLTFDFGNSEPHPFTRYIYVTEVDGKLHKGCYYDYHNITNVWWEELQGEYSYPSNIFQLDNGVRGAF